MAHSTGLLFLLLVGWGTTTVAQTDPSAAEADAASTASTTSTSSYKCSTSMCGESCGGSGNEYRDDDGVTFYCQVDATCGWPQPAVADCKGANAAGEDTSAHAAHEPSMSDHDTSVGASAGTGNGIDDGEWQDVYCVSDSRARVDAWTTQPTTTTTSTTRTTTTRTTTTRKGYGEDADAAAKGYGNDADAASGGWVHSSSDVSVLGRYMNTSKIRCMTESEKGTKNCRRSVTFAKDGRQQATSNEAGCSSTKVCSKEKMNTCTEKLVQRRGIAQYQIECCCNTTLCNEHSPVSKCALDAAGVPAGGASLAAGCSSADGITYKQSTSYEDQTDLLFCEPVTTSTSTSTSTSTTTTRTTTTRTNTSYKGYGNHDAHGAGGYANAGSSTSTSQSYCDGRQGVCGFQTFEGVVRSHCVARQFCYGRMQTCFEMRYPAGTLGPKGLTPKVSFSTTCCCGGNTTCPLFTLPESKCEGKQPGARPAECEAYLSPVHLLDFFDGVEAVETTVNTKMVITLTVPLDIDLASLTAAELADVKNKLLAAAAKAGGFDVADVERIELVQDGKVIGSARRGRAANGPITARVIFKDSAVVDLDAVVASVNSAIEAGTVSVSVVVGGETVTAAVSELAAVADKNIIIDTGGGTSGATRVAAATMATALMLLTTMA